MKGQAWRKVPSGISSPAPAFRSVGISQKSLPQILSHHPPVLRHPISKYLDTTWKLLEQYCLAVFKRKYSRLFFFQQHRMNTGKIRNASKIVCFCCTLLSEFHCEEDLGLMLSGTRKKLYICTNRVCHCNCLWLSRTAQQVTLSLIN